MTEKPDKNQKKTLLVILSDDLNQLVRKGEVVRDYYNPGDLFDRIELISVSGTPFTGSNESLRQMCGSAELTVTWIKRPSILFTFGWRQCLLRGWTEATLSKINSTPDLIRINGLRFNCLLALAARKKFKAPLVASIHEHGEINRKLEAEAFNNPLKKFAWRMYARRLKSISRATLNCCESVICVYKAAVDYVRAISNAQPELIYNCVSKKIKPKTDYRLSEPPRLLTVGNLVPGVKGPLNIIRSLVKTNATLDVIGEGALLESLQTEVAENGLSEQVNFLGYKPNDWIVKQMPGYDIYLFESHAREMSKSVIEAMLCGLPVIVNQHRKDPVAELVEAVGLIKVDNTPESFEQALSNLLENQNSRESAGNKARQFAAAHFDPNAMELKTAELYRTLMASASV